MTETNSPEQDRASGCKTNPELTGQSPKERGERVFSTAQCAVKPYGWHAAANGLFTVDERVAEVWRGHMGLNVTAVYAAQPPAAPVDTERDIFRDQMIACLRSRDDKLCHDAADEIELLANNVSRSAAETGEAPATSTWCGYCGLSVTAPCFTDAAAMRCRFRGRPANESKR